MRQATSRHGHAPSHRTRWVKITGGLAALALLALTVVPLATPAGASPPTATGCAVSATIAGGPVTSTDTCTAVKVGQTIDVSFTHSSPAVPTCPFQWTSTTHPDCVTYISVNASFNQTNNDPPNMTCPFSAAGQPEPVQSFFLLPWFTYGANSYTCTMSIDLSSVGAQGSTSALVQIDDQVLHADNSISYDRLTYDTITFGSSANLPPTAGVNYHPTGTTPNQWVFDGSPSVAAETGTTITNYAWNFGDGTTSATNASPTITHTFAIEGDRTVALTVTDSNGQIGSTTTTITPSLRISGVVQDPAAIDAGAPFTEAVTVQNDGTTTVTGVIPTVSPADPTIATFAPVSTPAPIAPGLSQTFTMTGTAGGAGSTTLTVAAAGSAGSSTITAPSVTRALAVAAPSLSITLVDPPAVLTGATTVQVRVIALGRQGATGVTVADPAKTSGSGAFSVTSRPIGADANFTLATQGDSKVVSFQLTPTVAGPLHYSVTVTGTDPISGATSAAITGSFAPPALIVTTNGDQALTSTQLTTNVCDVDTTSDGNQCTLRAALQLANQRADSEIVDFDIPGSGTPLIAPAAPLPPASSAVTIDGTSQPGGWIHLDGGSAGPTDGLVLAGANSSVRGLEVTHWAGAGLRIEGVGSAVVGNRLGTADGTAAAPDKFGILIEAASVTIGGDAGTSLTECSGDCNLISGNGAADASLSEDPRAGVLICGQGNGAHVEGNWIGTDSTGAAPLHNGVGVLVKASSANCSTPTALTSPTGVLIGAITVRPGAAPGNVISGNRTGVQLASGTGAQVAGNLIGTDATGTRGVSVSDAAHPRGVQVLTGAGYQADAPDTVVGGPAPGDRNIISGQSPDPTLARARTALRNFDDLAGAGVYGPAAVIGDWIGLDITGTHAIPNDVGVGYLVAGTVLSSTTVSNSVVSGNGLGIGAEDVGVEGQTNGVASVTGSRIGTTADGRSALGNIIGSSLVTTVGGVRPVGDTSCDGPCNLISGNTALGVDADLIEGNFIGTDLTGTRALPNSAAAADRLAFPAGATGATIGGPSGATSGVCDQACNLISGNAGWGANVLTTSLGNIVGRGIDGRPLPNGAGLVGNPGAVIGGDGLGQGNLIASNTRGAVIGNTGSPGVGAQPLTVLGNVITGNGGGIGYAPVTFAGLGYTPLAPGAGGVPVPPVLQTSSRAGSQVTVNGAAIHLPGVLTSYRIDVYASPACETPSEGALPVGHRTFTGPLAGSDNVMLTITVPAADRVLTATITENGYTSPFTDCYDIGTGGTVQADASASSVSAGGSLTVTGSGFAPGEPVDITLHSTPVRLALATADASGTVRDTVTIPADTAVGLHHLILTGLTSGVTVSIPLTVTVSGLASTGDDALPVLLELGLAALAAGLLLIVLTRVKPARGLWRGRKRWSY